MARYTSTKSQVWALDIVIAIAIFLTALLLFYKYSLNSIDIERKGTDDLLLDAKLISTYLVSEGYPADWDTHVQDVTQIGLTDGKHKIVPYKVQQFKNMIYDQSSYDNTRKMLSTTHDYYVFFEDKNNNTLNIGGVNWIGKDYSNEDPTDIIRTIRFIGYNSTIIRMVVYVW